MRIAPNYSRKPFVLLWLDFFSATHNQKKQDFMYLFPSLWVYLMNHKIIHL